MQIDTLNPNKSYKCLNKYKNKNDAKSPKNVLVEDVVARL